MNNWIAISYHTDDPIYRARALVLRESLVATKVPFYMDRIDHLGTWSANTNYKPRFCLGKLLYYQQPIVWLDADSEVVTYPDLFDTLTEDVGMRILKEKTPLTAVMYFNYSQGAIRFLQEWIRQTEKDPGVCDQSHLKTIYKTLTDVTLRPLPVSYCRIYDLDSAVEPVINQTQASRDYRARSLQINTGPVRL